MRDFAKEAEAVTGLTTAVLMWGTAQEPAEVPQAD